MIKNTYLFIVELCDNKQNILAKVSKKIYKIPLFRVSYFIVKHTLLYLCVFIY